MPRRYDVFDQIEGLNRPQLNLPMLGSTSWGLVAALPSAPTVGDRCYYNADEANGIIWELLYNGVGTFPWKCIGGEFLYSEAAAENATVSTAFVTEGSPSIVAPLKGFYMMEVSCRYWNSTAAAYGYFSPKIGAAAALDDNGAKDMGASAIGVHGFRRKRLEVAAAGTTIQTQIRVAAGNGFFNSRQLSIRPTRVG